MLRPCYIAAAFIGGAAASWVWFSLGGIIVELALVPAYRAATALLGSVSATGPFMDVIFGLSHALAALLLALPLAFWLRGPWLALFLWFLAGLLPMGPNLPVNTDAPWAALRARTGSPVTFVG